MNRSPFGIVGIRRTLNYLNLSLVPTSEVNASKGVLGGTYSIVQLMLV